MSKMYTLPSPSGSVLAPRDKKDIVLAGPGPKITKPRNFEQNLQRVKDTGVLRSEDFNSGAELGAFIDFYNSTVKSKKDAYFGNEVLEISKFLVRMMTTTSVVINKPKNDKI